MSAISCSWTILILLAITLSNAAKTTKMMRCRSPVPSGDSPSLLIHVLDRVHLIHNYVSPPFTPLRRESPDSSRCGRVGGRASEVRLVRSGAAKSVWL